LLIGISSVRQLDDTVRLSLGTVWAPTVTLPKPPPAHIVPEHPQLLYRPCCGEQASTDTVAGHDIVPSRLGHMRGDSPGTLSKNRGD
jgi:hypothetical protein